jgi:hypothetical protein
MRESETMERFSQGKGIKSIKIAKYPATFVREEGKIMRSLPLITIPFDNIISDRTSFMYP